ncbi:MAG TPA: formyltransferase family protein [Thermomicrobiales bacterium]|nr:formyltransferase family protein [Thermomicrobiales bacterium]
MRCRFTNRVVTRLLERRVPVVGIILPGPPGLSEPVGVVPSRSTLPVADSPTATFTAISRIPQYIIGQPRSSATRRIIESIGPDIILVACYPRLVPASLTNTARVAAWNIHPSLLPQNRGPDPLFWAFKRGDGRFGVTVHELSNQLDAGAVIAQREFAGWHGISESMAEWKLAEEGVDLAADAIESLVSGQAQREPQDERNASYESWPVDDDFRIDTSRSAQSAFNFIRGMKDRAMPLLVTIDGRELRIVDVVAYAEDDVAPPALVGDDVFVIRFNPGALFATAVVPRLRPEL